MMEIREVLSRGVDIGATDLFIISGIPLTYKKLGFHEKCSESPLMPEEAKEVIKELYKLAGREFKFDQSKDDDFSFAINGVGRFRVNAYIQRGSLAAVIRIIKFGLPNPNELNISKELLGSVYQTMKN